MRLYVMNITLRRTLSIECYHDLEKFQLFAIAVKMQYT